MGFTSAAANIPGIPIIDADDVFKSGDPERFAPLSCKQPHGTFSKGMFMDRKDLDDGLNIFAEALGGDGASLPPVIDDHVQVSPLDPGGLCRIDYGFGANLEDVPDDWLVNIDDVSGISAMVQEMEARGADLKTRIMMGVGGKPLPCKDQNGTNYCWINAPVHCFEINRLVANDELIIFSPASAGGPITGFRNVGGWGGTGLKWMLQNGICPADRYPANLTRKPSDYAAMQALAKNYLAYEGMNLPNFRSLASVLLRGLAGAVGYNWWSHEVTAIAIVIIDGVICLLCRNSWGMSYGDGAGFFILRGAKMRPDDACCMRAASPAGIIT